MAHLIFGNMINPHITFFTLPGKLHLCFGILLVAPSNVSTSPFQRAPPEIPANSLNEVKLWGSFGVAGPLKKAC
jgi:hypothetical protein